MNLFSKSFRISYFELLISILNFVCFPCHSFLCMSSGVERLVLCSHGAGCGLCTWLGWESPALHENVLSLVQGRAHEWLFSTEEGQWKIVESAQARRLLMLGWHDHFTHVRFLVLGILSELLADLHFVITQSSWVVDLLMQTLFDLSILSNSAWHIF